jgi:uncharacterized protein (DUF736 family)
MEVNRVGAGWRKESKNGHPYISCEIEHNGEKIRFRLFKNDRKQEGTKQPDYNVLGDTPREENPI